MRLLKRLRCTLAFEKKAWGTGAHLVAGVDEVGRGSLFGPVVAAAVILDPTYRIRGLRDSKLLPADRREVLDLRIREHAIAYAIAAVDAARIDQVNIYHASRLAMLQAVTALAPAADHLLIDALRIDWEWSDPEFAERVARPFLATLDGWEADPAVRRVVAVTHVPILEAQMTRDPGSAAWSGAW